jgi:hypothetical protein
MASGSRRGFLVALSAAGGVALVPSLVRGAGLKAELRTSDKSVKVGDAIEIELEVTREGGGPVPDPELPEGLADGFEITSSMATGSGFRITFGTGPNTRTSSTGLMVTAIALKPGTYPLSFTVDDGGNKVKSNVVSITVGAVDAAEVAPVAAGTKPTEARADVFVWATTDKPKAYVGEQIDYRMDVYERALMASVTLRTPPSFVDFYTYDLPEGEATVEDVAGVAYRVRPGMHRALFPQKAGKLVIGAPEITIGRRRRDRGPAVEVEVLPLPAEGQPPGFSPNNVGKLAVTAKADRTRVEAGQPLTWTVEISGDGNLALVDPGEWPEIAGARRYAPKVESQMRTESRIGGTRTYAFLVIPEAPGTVTLPAIEIDYFDPGMARYEVARAEPIAIEVTGTAVTPPGPDEATPTKADATTEETLAPIVAVDTLPRETVREPWLTPERWTTAMLALPGAGIVAWAATVAWRRFGPDDDARRRTQTKRRRRERIEAARAAVASGEGFHATVAMLLHELAVAKAGPSATGRPRPELVRMLEERGVPRADVHKLEALLDRCDAARFAKQHGTAEERTSLLEDAIALVERSELGRDERSAQA